MELIDYISKATEYFQKLSESELTKDVLIPLFKTMGFLKVDYHGGPYEKGKDLIMWKNDVLDNNELTVVQVKKWKISASSSSKFSFSEVVNQLQQASEEKVEHTDGKKYIPSAVYFITPFQIDVRSLNSRFEKYSELSNHHVTVIDGVKLSSLVEKHLPKLASTISGGKHAVQTVAKKNLNNLTLLNALDYREEKNISDFYSDIDITFGDITTNAFMNTAFNVKPGKQSVTITDWQSLKEICIEFKSKYDHNLLIKNIENIDREIENVDRELSDLNMAGVVLNVKSRRHILVELDTSSIKNFFDEKRKWLAGSAELLNNKDTKSSYREILMQCHELLKFINLITRHEDLTSAFNFDEIGLSTVDDEPTVRITSPMSDIIQTGMNLAILGDAGAGKTTCLQMQAIKTLSIDDDRVVLFLPLAQVMAIHEGDLNNIEATKRHSTFTNIILSFFRSEGVEISKIEFDKLLKENKALLLFDGIDEVISKVPWVINCIHEFGDIYQSAQIIISSRIGGEYLTQINYLGLGLLPFTNEQRDLFIKNWFKSPDDPKINSIINHVKNNSALRQVVRKPLLATIMCVLAEHDIPLPKNEIRLYKERMKLLTGHYDLHKKVRRKTSTQELLNTVACKLAFILHTEQKREDKIDVLIEKAVDALVPIESTYDLVSTAVRELIYPCNILVPTNYDDKYGFGLFRYQEYLVATVLNINRGISINQYFYSVWWKEVMVIFSQMSGDINYIVKDAIKSGDVTNAQDTLTAIIATLPSAEQKKHTKLINETINKEKYVRTISSSR